MLSEQYRLSKCYQVTGKTRLNIDFRDPGRKLAVHDFAFIGGPLIGRWQVAKTANRIPNVRVHYAPEGTPVRCEI